MRQALKIKNDDDCFANKEPIDKVLDIWAEFISLRDSQEAGGYANPQDVKDFMRVGQAAETMINDLRRHQWWAIRRSRSICTQWIFPDVIYEDTVLQARQILAEKMRLDVATAKYFS